MEDSPTTNTAVLKTQLRAHLRAARSTRTASAAHAATAALTRSAIAAGLHNLRSAGYLPMPGEPDVEPLLRRAGQGPGAWVPAILPGHRLGWGAWDAPRVTHSRFRVRMPGVLHPTAGVAGLRELAIELLLVPALAVDRRGVRLGQGGGYYDRLLVELPAEIRVVGVIFPTELLPEIPAEGHDVRLPEVLTPDGLTRLPAGL